MVLLDTLSGNQYKRQYTYKKETVWSEMFITSCVAMVCNVQVKKNLCACCYDPNISLSYGGCHSNKPTFLKLFEFYVKIIILPSLTYTAIAAYCYMGIYKNKLFHP